MDKMMIILNGGDYLHLQQLSPERKVKKSQLTLKMQQQQRCYYTSNVYNNLAILLFATLTLLATTIPIANCYSFTTTPKTNNSKHEQVQYQQQQQQQQKEQLPPHASLNDYKHFHNGDHRIEFGKNTKPFVKRRARDLRNTRSLALTQQQKLLAAEMRVPGEVLSSPVSFKKHQPQQFYFTDSKASAAATTTTHSNELVSYNLVERDGRENLCEYCECDSNKFITILCDFRQNPKLSTIFDSRYSIPSSTKSLIIKLAPGTQFVLLNGFFQQNKVNSIVINGTNSRRDQVELARGALKGSGGGYPEVSINDVFTVIIREEVYNGSLRFTVRNTNSLVLYQNAFAETEINAIFSHIGDLRIYEKAFSAGKIYIENSHLDDIFRFEASLNEIRFFKCTIGTINAGAFDVNSISSIVFENCTIDAIKARAVTDKLFSNHVSIKNGIIGYIESEAIYGSGITELVLSRNTIEKIYRNAIQATAVNVTIVQNSIKNLDNDWLYIKQWSNVFVEDNRFGIFGFIRLEEQARPSLCKFHNNSITLPLAGSLNFSECQVHHVAVNLDCVCPLYWLQSLTSHDLKSEIYCQIDYRLSTCFGTSNLNYLKYLNEVCDEEKTQLHCPGNQTLEKFKGNFYTPEELEQQNPKTLLYIVSGVSLGVLLFIIVIAVWLCRRYTGKKASENLVHPSYTHVHEFSPTDRAVIQSALKLMESRYKEIYKPISKKVKILYQPDLSEEKCVETVTKIVNLLKIVNSPPADFNAFNQILTQHLQPPLPSVPYNDSIYTEPGLNYQQQDSAYITTPNHNQVLVPNVPFNGVISHTVLNGTTDHIYAEPSCAQQPLLRNEYASPADRNTDPMDLYTEPITERVVTNPQNRPGVMNPALSYSIPTPSHLRLGQHLSPQNPLPDVLDHPHDALTHTRVRQDIQLSTFLPKPSTSTQVHMATNPHHQSNANTQPRSRNNLESFHDSAGWSAMNVTKAPNADSGSNHSGGTNETVPIDDIIEYVDA